MSISTLKPPPQKLKYSIAPRTNCISTYLIHSIPSVVLVSASGDSSLFPQWSISLSPSSSDPPSDPLEVIPRTFVFCFPETALTKISKISFLVLLSFFSPFLFTSPLPNSYTFLFCVSASLFNTLFHHQPTASIASGPTSYSTCTRLHVGPFDSFFSFHRSFHPFSTSRSTPDFLR